jgi:hypothetical protein
VHAIPQEKEIARVRHRHHEYDPHDIKGPTPSTQTFSENLADIHEKNRYDVVFANQHVGGDTTFFPI